MKHILFNICYLAGVLIFSYVMVFHSGCSQSQQDNNIVAQQDSIHFATINLVKEFVELPLDHFQVLVKANERIRTNKGIEERKKIVLTLQSYHPSDVDAPVGSGEFIYVHIADYYGIDDKQIPEQWLARLYPNSLVFEWGPGIPEDQDFTSSRDIGSNAKKSFIAVINKIITSKKLGLINANCILDLP